MRIAKVQFPNGDFGLAAMQEAVLFLLRKTPQTQTLTQILHSENPLGLVESLLDSHATLVPLHNSKLVAPLDQQEVWAAGVTYKRSQVARMEESETGASHYDRVYSAPRPELFFKATPHRVVGHNQAVRIRTDTKWSVPEPELGLVLSPSLDLVGFTIGNDMSARDIEGENPLYLPQAKVYDQCCALGPCILLPEGPLDREAMKVTLRIARRGVEIFRGETNVGQMKRTFEDLISWLGRDNSFPNGVILLTGTGVVPPNDFTLQAEDVVSIDITGIGTLTNTVAQG